MAPIRIAGAHNPCNQVEFEIELTDGEVLPLTVPKAQYIAKPIMDKYEPWLREWERKVTSPDTDPAERATMHEYDPMLKLFELILPKATYNKIAKLTKGELMALDKEWLNASDMSVGESSASDKS
ncbi:hypothetical protein [Nocardia sp. CC227C]|uniref:hypothetical protein n=1 Tax=Nocardia sp. CC227C TaxID=3044562 RepID=UPI00278C4031|nr:hypothetical protein [Nocardia sp. CC227C]